MNTADMRKFEQSQKNESRYQSKVCRKTRAL